MRRRPVSIGPIEYKDGLPWRVRLAFWIAPELRKELAHFGEQSRLLSYVHSAIRDV